MFALLKLKEKELESKKIVEAPEPVLISDLLESETAVTATSVRPPSPDKVESQSEQENEHPVQSSQDKEPAGEDEGWMDTNRGKASASPAHELKFLPNKLMKVPLSQLVWAPLPRWDHSIHFPGRVSSYSESLLDPNLVNQDFKSDEVVVIEFFGQEEINSVWLRNLIETKKAYPYWASSPKDDRNDYEPEQFLIWNKKAFDKLRQGLEKKMKNKVDAKKMYDHIFSTAQGFLRLAKEAEKDVPALPKTNEGNEEDAEDVPNFKSAPPAASTNKKKNNQPKKSLADFALHTHEDDNEPAPKLRVGDTIRYINPMFPDAKAYTHITGFCLDDRQNPLRLANDMVLNLQDFVAKISSAHIDTPQVAGVGSNHHSNAMEVIDVDSPADPIDAAAPATDDKPKRRKRKFGKSPPEEKVAAKPVPEVSKPTPKKKRSAALSSAQAASVSATPSKPQEGRLIPLGNYELVDENGRAVYKKTRKH